MSLFSSLSKSIYNLNRRSLSLQYVQKELNKFIQVRFGTSIPVVLIDDIENRGEKGDVISVKRGFARNYLIPRKLAVYATEINKIKFEKKRIDNGQMSNEIVDNHHQDVELLKSLSIILERPANTNGSLFASIGLSDVKEYCEKYNIKVNNINISSTIKTIGIHTINIDNHSISLEIKPTV